MIIEYKGTADFQVGMGEAHEVRAFWNSMREDQGAVKRAASKAVREVVGKGGSVTFESWDMDTYKSPSLAAIIRVRVLTPEQVAKRKELRERCYTKCELCRHAPPVELVRMHDGSEGAMCYSCRRGLQEKYQVVYWIKADGRLQIN